MEQDDIGVSSWIKVGRRILFCMSFIHFFVDLNGRMEVAKKIVKHGDDFSRVSPRRTSLYIFQVLFSQLPRIGRNVTYFGFQHCLSWNDFSMHLLLVAAWLAWEQSSFLDYHRKSLSSVLRG